MSVTVKVYIPLGYPVIDATAFAEYVTLEIGQPVVGAVTIEGREKVPCPLAVLTDAP